MTIENSDHWSDYWAQGRLTSLPQDFAANYDGEIAGFWLEAFQGVPENGSMIDLCTGNGAIALLAVEYTGNAGHAIEVTAVDAATVSPESITAKYPDQAGRLDHIHFISDCKVENLDLQAGSFDLVTSQFGIEYCDLPKAAAQVERLLKSGGRLVMVNHTATSDILKFMEQELREYELLQQLGMLSAIRDYLQGKASYDSLRTTLGNAQGTLSSIFQKTGSPLFGSVLSALGGILNLNESGLEARRTELEEYYAQIRHGFDRLVDMLRVNQAIESDPEWFRVFESAGLELLDSGDILYRGQHHAGGYIVFRKH